MEAGWVGSLSRAEKALIVESMTDSAALLRDIDALPPEYREEVSNFVSYLKLKNRPAIPTTMLQSEAALAKDWDTPEEDAAWACL